jgi:uncharacterized glyoxalase superfamily protein PhnB
MSVTLDAYLFFPGDTEQAISFYQEVFGGQTTITRRGDVDPPPVRRKGTKSSTRCSPAAM